MEEYRIKFRNKFIVEGELYGTFDLTYCKGNAMTFNDRETALLYVETDLHLNVCSVRLHVTEIIIKESELACIEGEWLPSEEIDQCTECGKYFPLHLMHKGVIDRESGLELFCEKCYTELDSKNMFIVGNQKLDEEVE